MKIIAQESATSSFATTSQSTTTIQLPEIKGEVLGAETFHFSKNLLFGMKSDAVMELQNILLKEGFYHSASSGYFDEKTKSALKEYQKKHGIFPSGILGSATREFINR